MQYLGRDVEATVCIPWRPSPSRMAAFDRVMGFWEFTGWPIVLADSETEIFSLARARNSAVRQAETDVVIVADADTIPPLESVVQAVADPRGVCWPFEFYHMLPMDYVDAPLDELAVAPHLNPWDAAGLALGGAMVCTRDTYWRLGGQPPEFIGWGWEDVAFLSVVRTLSTPRRLPGTAYTFEHNTGTTAYVGRKADSPGWDRDNERNHALYRRYLGAEGRPWLMRELLIQRAEDS